VYEVGRPNPKEGGIFLLPQKFLRYFIKQARFFFSLLAMQGFKIPGITYSSIAIFKELNR
jgi:hypothetical protein